MPGFPHAPGDPIEVGQPLSGAALLAAWENGAGEPLPARGLAVLRAGCPGLGHDHAAELSVAQRDHALLMLHVRSFGPNLTGTAECEACGERLEFVLPAAQVAASLQAAEAGCSLMQDGLTLRLRLATSRDIMAIAAEADVETARQRLLDLCAETADAGGAAVAIPDALRGMVMERLDALHEAAEVALALSCPGCGSRQTVQLDIASFLWVEIRHAAQRLLDDVHELAWAYGWSEAAILTMTPVRRQAYLERLRG